MQAIYTLSKILADDSKEGLVPLYDLYKNNGEKSMLLQYTIDNIADERKKYLKAETKDNINETIRILEKIDPMISSMTDNENYIDDVWSKLASKWSNDLREYLISILNQEFEIIDLPSNQISRAVVIFERINRGGTSLDNFDLVVARAARNNCVESLNKRIIKALNEKFHLSDGLTHNLLYEKPMEFSSANINAVNENEIDSIIKKQYLNLLSIFSYVNYGEIEKIKIDLTKKNKILNMSHEQINNLTNNVIESINRACAFLNIRCGITSISELNYNLMMLPLAYLLINDSVWNDKAKIDRLEYWYWGSILSGEYRYNPNDRSIRDIQNLYRWIVKGENIQQYNNLKDTVLSVPGFCDKEILLRKNKEVEIPTIIHKTILQYILSRQPKDLLYDIPINSWDISYAKIIKIDNEKFKNKTLKIDVQDHHIIPLGTATTISQSTKEIRRDKNNLLNSILNRTYILADTNNVFSDENPSKYLKEVLEINKSRSSFQQHYISSDYEELFSGENYNDVEQNNKFFESRYNLIKAAIQLEMNTLLNS